MDLLEHNRNTKIIWEHAGWSNTGIATAELLSQMMGENSNLYLAVKLRKPETTERNAAHPLDETGMIKSEWLNLSVAKQLKVFLVFRQNWEHYNFRVISPYPTSFSPLIICANYELSIVSLLLGCHQELMLGNMRRRRALSLLKLSIRNS